MDAKTRLGREIRRLREAASLSQERLAEQADITYQYLSGVENGRENFTIGVLEAVATSLGVGVSALVAEAFDPSPTPPPKVRPEFFNSNFGGPVLPPGLSYKDLEAVLNETHSVVRLINTTLTKVIGRPLSQFIQANNFSGIVSNILSDCFSRLTPYKHNHHQKYPDLVREDDGAATAGLEIKTTIKVGKGGESHNGHSGWHMVACFQLDTAKGDVCFIHVMFAELIGHGQSRSDWKYVGSQVNDETGSQRTETYMTTPEGTAKLRHGTAYLDRDQIDISRWRTADRAEIPVYSLFQAKRRQTKRKQK